MTNTPTKTEIFQSILSVVTTDTGIHPGDLTGISGFRNTARISHARWEIFAQLYARGWSAHQIAQRFKRPNGQPMDHSNVSYGLKHKTLSQTKPENNKTA